MRVLLLEVPYLLRGILQHAIQLHGGCELMTDTRHTLQMLKEQGVSPDIVILGLSVAEDATLVPALFARWPSAQVMTVSQAGDEAAVWELRPRRRALGQMSAPDMMNELRTAVDERRRNVQE